MRLTDELMGRALGIFLCLIGIAFAGLAVEGAINNGYVWRWMICSAAFNLVGYVVYMFATAVEVDGEDNPIP